MAEKRISIEVDAATADLSGIKKTKSALDDLGKGGPRAVEKLEQSFIKLRKSGIEVRDEFDKNQKAQKALNARFKEGRITREKFDKATAILTRREAALRREVTRVKKEMETNRLAIERMNTQQRLAQEKAQQLAATFGIMLPGSMAKYVSQLSVVQKAVTAAFSGILILGFADILARSVIPRLVSVWNWLTDISERQKQMLEMITAWNQEMLKPETLQQAGALATNLQQRRNELEEILRLRTEILTKIAGGGGATREELALVNERRGQGTVAVIKESLQELDKQIEELDKAQLGFQKKGREDAAKAAEDLRKRENDRRTQQSRFRRAFAAAAQSGLDALDQQLNQEQGKRAAALTQRLAQHSAALTMLQRAEEAAALARLSPQQAALEQIRMAEIRQVEEFRRLRNDSLIDEEQFQAARVALATTAQGQVDALERQQLERRRQAIARITDLEAAAAQTRTGVHQAALMEIARQEQRSVGEIRLLRDQGLINEQEFQDARVALAISAEARHREVIQQFGRDLEGFYDRTIGAASTASEAIKNIWGELTNFWKRQVFDQVAAFLLGQQRMVAGAGPSATLGTSSGGILGGILGAGLGLPGVSIPSTGPGGTPPFIQNALPGGTGLGIGGGAGAAVAARTAPTVASSLGLPATTPIGTVLASLARSPAALGLGGLAGASLVGNSNRIVSGLGGFFGGGLLGVAAGGTSLLAGTALGAFAGPIGALVGLGLGLLFGGGGDKKRQDTAVANQGFAQLRQVLEDFERHRIDFQSAISTANNVWAQMSAAFVRSESIRTQRPFFDEIMSSIRRTEDERNRRRQIMSLQAVPEFAAGGAVPAATQSLSRGLLAVLHPGEFVMNRQAVERIGLSVLEGLNTGSGARGQESGTTVTLEIPSQEFFNEVVERSIPVILTRGGKASKILRG